MKKAVVLSLSRFRKCKYSLAIPVQLGLYGKQTENNLGEKMYAPFGFALTEAYSVVEMCRLGWLAGVLGAG